MRGLSIALLMGLALLMIIAGTALAQEVQITIPAVEVEVTAQSINGMPLGKYAIVGLNCEGFNETGLGNLTAVIPIPSTGSISCRAYASSFGVAVTKDVVITASESGEVIPVTVVIPVSGLLIPGVGFVPISTLILIAVAILVIIIIVIIGLMEYARWRRERLARLLKPPE
ncbi:hypothetical protein [Vulcanisaeta thermophila]|uniref:hypothetical protein n=1 Tax=Vulcanisaeta thermophila TaxID=867917 RepID=UPI0008536A58|nr:hypothetical protein [Vulcanisaeta thermophila]